MCAVTEPGGLWAWCDLLIQVHGSWYEAIVPTLKSEIGLELDWEPISEVKFIARFSLSGMYSVQLVTQLTGALDYFVLLCKAFLVRERSSLPRYMGEDSLWK